MSVDGLRVSLSGKDCPVEAVRRLGPPRLIGLVADLSLASRLGWSRFSDDGLRGAVEQLLEPFADEVRYRTVLLRDGRVLSLDHALSRTEVVGFLAVEPSGGTALADGLWEILKHAGSSTETSFILLLPNGMNTISYVPEKVMLRLASQAGVPVFIVNPPLSLQSGWTEVWNGPIRASASMAMAERALLRERTRFCSDLSRATLSISKEVRTKGNLVKVAEEIRHFADHLYRVQCRYPADVRSDEWHRLKIRVETKGCKVNAPSRHFLPSRPAD
ncbi:MAG: hypothetical protein WAO20_19005 [Acidobacteriota bacterium]